MPPTGDLPYSPRRSNTELSDVPEQEFDRNFQPRGAIAFFILLIILGAVIWYSIYFLMLQRG